ncbi:probable serine/threonine-protein kinase nek3 isoform X2 [Melanaphis sacchari]|uniref:probable serine/threonine-protein kinase nek3 isoform X2 n=1 Tax=Melanaphis sacchari TaxID=742174 RepID=UPI000DC14A49|nr:probable serine/threonine-protein kinase nek3 isoform X2 [Melanaphis sacchari]
MDQNNPRPSCSSSTFPTPTAVTCQAQTTQMASTIISPPTNSYVLTSSNLRPVTNYTLVASSQVPVTHQYVVQSTTRTTIPQYVSTGNVKHIVSPSTQQSNVTYMLPSGAHIVRMNNVVTTTVAGEQKSNTQYILTSSTQKTNSSIISPLGTQSPITSVSTDTEKNFGSSATVSRTVSVTTCTSPIFQKAGLSFPRLNATYYSQIKGNDTTKISFRPKLNEQKPGTSYILTSNDWSRTKNVPMSSLQKINTNYMQIPLIQKPGNVISTNTLRSNVDIQQQKSQPQPIRSVILPSNYRTAVSQQQSTDCKLVLNSINVTTQGINSTDSKPSSSNTSVSSIQQLNTNYMQIPISQKPGTILTRNNTQPNIENNIRIGQHQTIRSVILPSNYRTAMVSSPRRGVDYRLILKPVIRNVPPPRLPSPRNNSVRNASPRQTIQRQTSPRQNSPRQSSSRQSSPRQSLPRQTPLPIRSNSFPTRVPLPRPSTSIHNEVIANSKITPIPLRKRIKHLVITERSIKICMDEINNKHYKDSPNSNLTDAAIKVVQAEVTYRLFYLLRECKKFLIRSRSNVLTEEAVRQVCAEYFGTFFGNKLWPLFCLKWIDDGLNSENDENRVWMRKHNNVNLIGWLKHPKFRNPSYIQKRHFMNLMNTNPLLPNLENISEVMYEHKLHNQTNQESPSRKFYQSLKSDQVSLNKIVAKKNDNVFTPTSHKFMDIPLENQMLSSSKQISSTIIQSQRTHCNPE